jgi:transcriptional regulator with XRE-family HTH domain
MKDRSFGVEVNRTSFALVLKRVREARRLSLRESAAESGIDAATHCRAERGERLDYDTYVYLCRWAGFPEEAFAAGGRPGAPLDGLPTPDKIEVVVHADGGLRPETAAALARMMRTAYGALAGATRRE